MKEYINKKVKIHRVSNGTDLFYKAVVLSVTENHITVKDKYEKIISFRVDEIMQIEVVE